MPPTLADVEALVNQLSEADRAQLRERLATSRSPAIPPTDQSGALWQRLDDIGAELSRKAGPGVTERLLNERR